MVINLAAPSLDRSLGVRLSRLPRVLRGLGRLVSKRGLCGTTLYMSASGGLGQAYELAFLLLARLRGMRVFLHHHSFAYLDEPSALTRALVRAAGADAIHVTLSPKMAKRLISTYGAGQVVPVSNCVFLMRGDMGQVRLRESPNTVGFISNIAPDKGVFEFLDLMVLANAVGLSLEGRLAGPFQDAETERAVRDRLEALPEVQYVGPKYGAAKDKFFAGIDVLAFPTRYANEAEPVTIHEAMSRGIPVIAYGRGCIPEIVGPDCGLVIDPSEPFGSAALTQLERWLADFGAFRTASKVAAARYASTYEQNEAGWRVLLEDIVRAPMRARCTRGNV